MSSTNVPFTQYLLELMAPVLGPAVAARQLYNAASDVFNQQVQAPVYDYNLAVPQNPTPEMLNLYEQLNGSKYIAPVEPRIVVRDTGGIEPGYVDSAGDFTIYYSPAYLPGRPSSADDYGIISN